MLRVAVKGKIYYQVLQVLRVALKKEKYTRVFVFRPCLFHIEGGLMFVFVNTCGNQGSITQGS